MSDYLCKESAGCAECDRVRRQRTEEKAVMAAARAADLRYLLIALASLLLIVAGAGAVAVLK